MNIFQETYIELDFNKAKRYAIYFNEMFNVPVSVYDDNNNGYLIVPIPEKHQDKLKHLMKVEVLSFQKRHS